MHRVALVGVAADVLLHVAAVAGRKAPLHRSGSRHRRVRADRNPERSDNLVRRHLGQRLTQCGIAVHADILLDVLGVDHAAVAQCHAQLGLIEHGIVQRGMLILLVLGGSRLLVVNQTFNHSSLEQVLVHDLHHVIGGNMAVKGSVRVYDDNGTEGAKAEASGLTTFTSSASPCRSISCWKISWIFWLPDEVHPVPPQHSTCARIMLCYPPLLAYAFCAAAKVYSSTILPPLMCFSMTSAARSGVILT